MRCLKPNLLPVWLKTSIALIMLACSPSLWAQANSSTYSRFTSYLDPKNHYLYPTTFGCGTWRLALNGPEISIVQPAIMLQSVGGNRSLATVTNTTSTVVTWGTQERLFGGKVEQTGFDIAPQATGMYHVVTTSQTAYSKVAAGTVTVASEVDSGLTKSPWPKFHHDNLNTGSTGSSGGSSGASMVQLWAFKTGDMVKSSPAIGADGTIYIGSHDGYVYALDGVTGAKKWAFKTGGPVDWSPAIGVDGTVYVGSFDFNLYALDGKTGAKKWVFHTGPPIIAGTSNTGTPTIGSNNTVYYGAGDGNLYAINGTTGKQKWAAPFHTDGYIISPPAITADGAVVFGSHDGRVYAVDSNTGLRTKWKQPFQTGSDVWACPGIGSDGTIYIGSYDANMYALDGKTGTKKWSFPTKDLVVSSAAIASDGTIYFGSYDNFLYAVDGKTGAMKWRYNTGSKIFSTPAIDADGTVYFGSYNNNVYAVDGKTGNTKWVFPTGGWIFSSPAIGANGTVYVGSEDGYVYAIQLSTKLDNKYITLTDDPSNPTRKVAGIVCDNVAQMDLALRDCLKIRSDYLKGAINIVATVVNDQGTQTDTKGENNVGTFHVDSSDHIDVDSNGAITYYPPNEFNFEQQPADATGSQITYKATRVVHLRLSFTKAGKPYFIDDQPIIVARPPVVLVHGINSSPSNWQAFISAFVAKGIPCVTVNHNNPRSYTVGLMNGNAPVEIGALLLKKRIDMTLQQLHDGIAITDADENIGNEVNSFTYPGSLAARRIDVVAWSYGGVITRWYIASKGVKPNDDWPWYQRDFDHHLQPLPSDTKYNNDIRKLITLGSMWRGVPLANYVNEANFADVPAFAPQNGITLGSAPLPLSPNISIALFGKLSINNVRDFINALQTTNLFASKVPSMEVVAINSPWQCQMIYGQPDLPIPNQPAYPFDDNTAYGSVAGDDHAYLANVFDPSSLIDDFQLPSYFPYLRLERRDGIHINNDYTDGLVPIWSAAIPISNAIISVNHGDLPKNKDVQNKTIQWLNSNELPLGNSLNKAWNSAQLSAITMPYKGKTWNFRTGEMAPHAQNDLYTQVNNERIGRITPFALLEINNLINTLPANNTVTITYSTGTDTDTLVTLYTLKNGSFSQIAQKYLTKPVKLHSVTFSGLNPKTTYYYDASSTLFNPPDTDITVSSNGKISFKNP